jgi:hypothetical protein
MCKQFQAKKVITKEVIDLVQFHRKVVKTQNGSKRPKSLKEFIFSHSRVMLAGINHKILIARNGFMQSNNLFLWAQNSQKFILPIMV